MRAPLLFLFLVLLGLLLLLWSYRSTVAVPPTPEPTKMAVPGLPVQTLRAYQKAGQQEGVSWKLLLALGAAESDHGRSPLPGVRGGINSAGCCAGPMQLCVRDSCGNVASVYARDGDGDGQFSVYDIDDATATAASYLRWMQDFLGPDPALLAAGYNAGPTIVRQKGIPPYPETRLYVQKVRKTLEELS